MDQAIAQWIGSNNIVFLLILSLVTLSLIFWLWRVIENYHEAVWQLLTRGWTSFKALPYVQHLSGQSSSQRWLFWRSRLTSIMGYLEIYLVVGLMICIVTFGLFGAIADEVMEKAEIVKFDLTLANALHDNSTPIEVSFFSGITSLGGRNISILLGLGVALILAVLHKRLLLLAWVAALIGNSLLNAVLKAFFQRGRPEFNTPLLVEPYYSFPSGHAMGSIVMYGMITYLLILWFKRGISMFIVMIMVILVLLIGFSRLYLGVHFFSDVMGGYLAGLGWLSIVILGIETARRHEQWWHRPQTSSGTEREVIKQA
jgi:undecaprenyl-diphosphatase